MTNLIQRAAARLALVVALTAIAGCESIALVGRPTLPDRTSQGRGAISRWGPI